MCSNQPVPDDRHTPGRRATRYFGAASDPADEMRRSLMLAFLFACPAGPPADPDTTKIDGGDADTDADADSDADADADADSDADADADADTDTDTDPVDCSVLPHAEGPWDDHPITLAGVG